MGLREWSQGLKKLLESLCRTVFMSVCFTMPVWPFQLTVSLLVKLLDSCWSHLPCYFMLSRYVTCMLRGVSNTWFGWMNPNYIVIWSSISYIWIVKTCSFNSEGRFSIQFGKSLCFLLCSSLVCVRLIYRIFSMAGFLFLLIMVVSK